MTVTAKRKAANSHKADHLAKHQFKPGQSGNPRGRPKKETTIEDLAKENSDKALRKLIKLVDSDDERIALAAAQAVIDRGLGKPKQQLAVEKTIKREADELSDYELESIAAGRGANSSDSTEGQNESDRVH